MQLVWRFRNRYNESIDNRLAAAAAGRICTLRPPVKRRLCMKAFMDKDFLLDTATARRLYHDYAAGLPIIDYHCHIPP